MLHGKKQKKRKQRNPVKPRQQLEVPTEDCSTGEALKDDQVLEGMATQLR